MSELSETRRFQTMGVAVGQGARIGVVSGAVAGTFAIPILGTIFGGIAGVIVALVPAMAGGAAVFVAAKPGRSVESFRRQVAAILAVIGLAVVSWVWAFCFGDGRIAAELTRQIVLGCAVAIGMLRSAYRQIIELNPAPAGTPTPLVEWVVVGALLCFLTIVPANLFWSSYLSPMPQLKRSVIAERDAIFDALDVEPSTDSIPSGTMRIDCTVEEDGGEEASSGYQSWRDGTVTGDLHDQARRELEERGYEVSIGEHPLADAEDDVEVGPRRWVYGVRGRRSILIDTDSYGDVTVEVGGGCPLERPE